MNGTPSGRELANDLVSIITPVFNSERFIEETIRSAQAQTYWHWEMLVLIDGGTKDRTAELVQAMAAADSRIKLIDVPGSRSVTDARNYGFKVARGRFIAFLDADDLWLPTKLDKQLKLMRETQAGLSYTAYRRISVNGAQTGREIPVPEQITYTDLLKTNRIGCLTAVVDQKLTGPLHMASDQHEDYVLWLDIVKKTGAAEGVCEDLARYRVVPGSRSANKVLMAGWRWNVYRKQEGLSVLSSLYFYVCYAVLTLAKHLRF